MSQRFFSVIKQTERQKFCSIYVNELLMIKLDILGNLSELRSNGLVFRCCVAPFIVYQRPVMSGGFDFDRFQFSVRSRFEELQHGTKRLIGNNLIVRI